MEKAKEKIVLIGAGSAMFTRGLVADLIRLGMETELALVDINPDALNAAERLVAKMIKARRAKVKLSATTDRRKALRGATVVITTIAVGGRRAWEQDVFVPRKFDIYMPVGDSVGPSGTSRALRMVPAMVAIARDVVELAPQADFFNYSNPMAVVCQAVRKATGANVVGLCHGVWHVAHYLASFLGVDFSRFGFTAVGMNHLTWFTEMRVDGRDAMDLARAQLKQQKAEGEARKGRPWHADHPFTWELFELFGAYPAVFDAHVVEFFPGLFPGGIYRGKKLGVEGMVFENIIRYGDKIFDEMRSIALDRGPLPRNFFSKQSGEHEQVMEIIRAMRADSGAVYSVNLPNAGRLGAFEQDVVIEGPAAATGAGLRPLAVPQISAGVAGTLATRMAWVELAAQAGIEASRQKFIQALLIDGYTRSIEEATRLAAALLKAQAEHLREFGWKV